jgi:hypothetical protein
VAQYGAAWHSMVRRGSVWCGVAQYGAAWLSMVRCGSVMVLRDSVMVRRGSAWCGVAQYGVALLNMVRRGSVDSASAFCRAGPSSILDSVSQGGFPTELTSDEEMERDLGEWRRINVLYECG